MSYSTEEYFEDHILSELRDMIECFKELKENETCYDIFRKFLNKVFEFRGYDYRLNCIQSDILTAICGEYSENLYNKINTLFTILSMDTEEQLKKIEYISNNDLVICEYNIIQGDL